MDGRLLAVTAGMFVILVVICALPTSADGPEDRGDGRSRVAIPCHVKTPTSRPRTWLFLAVSAALTALMTFLHGIFPILETGLVVVDFALSIVLTSALFAAMYKVLPDTPIAWHDVIVGAVCATLLFAGGKDTGIPAGLRVETPYDSLSFVPT